jgi:hypothetical protein
MFDYPKQAEVGRKVPKSKIFAHVRASKRLKELFTTQVEEICWKYKLSPETVNLPARNGINEIQIFEITLKDSECDDAVLQLIDKAVPFPLLFQLHYGNKIRFAASYKRPNEADESKWVVETMFQTEPKPYDAKRLPLPVALDLAGLYEQIVQRHIPLPPRGSERVSEHVARFNAIAASEKEQLQLEKQMAQEKQFNRKVELNSALRSLKRNLNNLKET